MRAAVYRRFGGPDAVRIEERPKPAPGPGELLVKVRAVTVSAADYRARTKKVPKGLKLPTSITLGFVKPRIPVLGMDLVGIVESVGAGVTRFKPGDEVMAMLGAKFGGHAEYATVPEDGAVTAKPRNLTFEEAAALVFGGITAQAFMGRAALRPGARVLIIGASGAVGTAAMQLATLAGAHVTAVCSGSNADLVRSLGAQRVIDYATEDFTAVGETYDVVMDCVGNVPFGRLEPVIKPGGSLLSVVADLAAMLTAGSRSRRTGKRVTAGNVPFTAADLARVAELAETGRLRPVIDRILSLPDIAEAHRYVDAGRKVGNVVVQIAGAETANPSQTSPLICARYPTQSPPPSSVKIPRPMSSPAPNGDVRGRTASTIATTR
ncbi:Zn-dependent oxidoreductase, NADPH:quinone reductase [Pseudarthrobacter phenanthrenivorans Sphe3]|uniref:Zn-dependent oxidoreductase, NADPH:quinone reductase n=1 Tax=Pseudarthrobacter phenanthrenivorans (strain DSM 18606 / JCM 16027 / LMG 23796 / Sphe3) TaxID=930171 RepID=F0M1K3_PSEPM|nr:NAD(P)-dependent alcohol dehydrogenase [Pseudarthrobacter phenanthrenivorans]ADX74199.1 Zn-dependent oxidoreductase, NADPH:quinone reductase [Pseudarthrobacter phenanthrenivorans Sphe3]